MQVKTVMAAMLLSLAAPVLAESVEERITTQIRKIDAQVPVVSVQPAPLSGLYEVELGSGDVIFADAKGEYFLLGQLYQLDAEQGFINLSEQKANDQRKQALAALDAEQLVTFPAEGEQKAHVYVFTDVDCPYCRKLHDEVPQLQSMGITVSYLAFPRQGAGSAVQQKMSAIWCAADKQAAMNQAKSGQTVTPAKGPCQDPVMDQYQLGQRLGVNGTPAIITTEGKLLPGYVPAQRLATMLEIEP